ncbi:hypothetical protein GLAREA_04354 [Glarea lozoyensis ATCC 20868]|uniref:Heterokaryon incompatibility domain-containing protein n=1 Tax=Glarea lozoyensis (strain ATCC 20868 / MF5171) TaxID=1116229 RepID=S3DM09_GLAL2|nr:uncharacterized protein GLAREA_04354 [Glarea lozoyensis ATCC 20868]EPE27563.1 hypothetical protein GLAREA_04354 [Glarea lozoyensis ATCC 20868]
MTKDNLQQITSGIEIAELPKTFQDAVTVTRALGLKYLWIDSLCIIQKSSAAGDAESAQDWARESKLMDQVFSQAYFTIAAGCAEHRFDGFLKHRAAREFVTMSTDDKEQFHVCEIIDKFDAEVEQGELNQRGWVLQERALSRRTVHFTATQSYWECGDGILCETFTKTTNRKASFLSDSNFPLAVQAYKEGMTLQLHQNLYERYSTLALSFPTDRPRAIAGLERRLMKALHSKGGYGVFQSSTRNQDFFHRGLLWQRAGKELKRLDGIEGSVPTWSWMAYEGEIRYMNVPFLDIEKNRDIGSPFEDLEEGVVHSDLVDRGPAELRARVWRVREVVKGRVIWDEGEGVQKKGKKVGGGDENQNLKNGRMWCVIVGKSVKPRDEGRIAYVIMVGPVTDLGKDNQGKGKLYQRRGVGYLNVDDLEDEDGGGQEIGSIR